MQAQALHCFVVGIWHLREGVVGAVGAQGHLGTELDPVLLGRAADGAECYANFRVDRA